MSDVHSDSWRKQLRDKAGQIRQERWFVAHPFAKQRGSEVGGMLSRDRVCADMKEHEAEYIALLDPITVSEMLDYIDELEKLIIELGD